MTTFGLYFTLGWQHIADLQAYDHILFIVALSMMHPPQEWRRSLLLVTAFTVGHSVTLAMATLNLLLLPPEMVEFLIPVTIFATAFANVLGAGSTKLHPWWRYFSVVFFGFIHGMGFSSYLRLLLQSASEIALPLLAFNIGLEIGQILILAVIAALTFLAFRIFNISQRDWKLFLSGAVVGISFILMTQTKFW